jgi:hypothetical protein
MTLLKQTDINHTVIKRWGCNLRCLQAVCELEAGRSLTESEIISLYGSGVAKGSIGTNCYINDNDAILAETALLLGLKTVPKVKQGGGDYLRVCYKTPYGVPHGFHYVLLSPRFGLYNPDPSLQILSIEGVRYYA